MRRAAKFAAADINAAGGNVAFEEVDIDRALFFEGKQPADSLRELVDKGVKGLVGPTTSVTSVASFRFVTDNGLVTISPSVNSDSISDLNRKESDLPFLLLLTDNATFSERFRTTTTRRKFSRKELWARF